MAKKPDSPGNGNSKKEEHVDKSEKSHSQKSDERGHASNGGDSDVHVTFNFGDRQRTVIRNYYHKDFGRGHCPPGLAKKNNGCMPPGQAKKWARGQRLPRNLIYYDLPHDLLVELGPPPSGHKFVRVAADILLIAVGTGLIVDAVEDLNSL